MITTLTFFSAMTTKVLQAAPKKASVVSVALLLVV